MVAEAVVAVVLMMMMAVLIARSAAPADGNRGTISDVVGNDRMNDLSRVGKFT